MAKTEKRKYSDRRQYLIRAVYQRRKKVRQMAVEYKGGKCETCGYYRCIDAFEFHHNDLSKKDFGISEKGYTRSWNKVMQELDKCKLLCANCHRELHAKLAASRGNSRVQTELLRGSPEQSEGKSGLIQGNRNVESTAILSYPSSFVMESADTIHPPSQILG